MAYRENCLLPLTPPAHNKPSYKIRIDGIPESGAKSRVETQIKLCLSLVNLAEQRPSYWSHLRIPNYLLAKSKGKNQYQHKSLGSTTTMVSDESKVLNLEARVICESDETKDIKMCSGCIRRERKRAERKKSAKLTTDREFERLLIFNCGSLVAFDTASATFFIRITCYCRHHSERIGYRVRFVLRDYQGQVIATGETPIILITDDHRAIKESIVQREADNPFIPLPTPEQEQDDIWCSSMRTTPFNGQFHLPNESCPTNNEIRHDLPWPIRMTCLASTEPLQVQDSQGQTICVPTLESVVPDSGPVMGGLEITLLGNDFSPDLVLMFGNSPAVILQCHPTCLVCLLPPANKEGNCLLSFRDTPLIRSCPVPPTFNYYDSSYHDISQLTFRITSSPFVFGPLLEPEIIQLLSQHEGFNLAETTPSGQTLLHLACHLGYSQLALLLMQKAPQLVDRLDRNGFPALYYASNSPPTLIQPMSL